jgi:hypothetical protein
MRQREELDATRSGLEHGCSLSHPLSRANEAARRRRLLLPTKIVINPHELDQMLSNVATVWRVRASLSTLVLLT